MDRLFEKINKDGECWMWTAGTDKDGYGKFKIAGRTFKAHRVAWEIASGREIPEGLIVMHACDTPGCCRPDHLVLGTLAENNADRAAKKRSYESQKTHCPKGHEYSEDNTITDARGWRKCQICTRATARKASRRYYAKQKAIT